MKPLAVIGLNSGTSMDGVDAALFAIAPQCKSLPDNLVPRLQIEMHASLLVPFDKAFRDKMRALIASGRSTLEELCRLNAALGHIFADAAQQLMRQAGLSLSEAHLIGSHGQTLWHAPERKSLWGVPAAGSLQLGDGATIAARLGIPVVSDFRTADIAAGGQGAPLVPFADQVLFGHLGRAAGVLNIGGIANITVLSGSGEAVMAFDTGPGNMIIDRAARVLFDLDHDPQGSLAAAGHVHQQWLAELLAHPYYAVPPPKSTGRELFGHSLADGLIDAGRQKELTANDIIATLTALTAFSIGENYRRFIQATTPLNLLILGGGGAENATLVSMIRKAWPEPVELRRHEDFGISTKFKEALLFALLAYTTFFHVPNNVPRCTGAGKRVCLGKLSFP